MYVKWLLERSQFGHTIIKLVYPMDSLKGVIWPEFYNVYPIDFFQDGLDPILVNWVHNCKNRVIWSWKESIGYTNDKIVVQMDSLKEVNWVHQCKNKCTQYDSLKGINRPYTMIKLGDPVDSLKGVNWVITISKISVIPYGLPERSHIGYTMIFALMYPMDFLKGVNRVHNDYNWVLYGLLKRSQLDTQYNYSRSNGLLERSQLGTSINKLGTQWTPFKIMDLILSFCTELTKIKSMILTQFSQWCTQLIKWCQDGLKGVNLVYYNKM